MHCHVLLALLVLGGCGWQEQAPPAGPVAEVWGVHHPVRAAERLRRSHAVRSVTVARRSVALLRSRRRGYAIPLDVLAVRPRGVAATAPEADRAALAALRPGEAALSATSARLRHAAAGDVLRLAGGRRLRVAALVSDAAAHDAEVIVPRPRGRPLSGRPRTGTGRSGPVDWGPPGDPWRAALIVGLEPGARVSPRVLARRAQRGAGARIVGGPGPVGPARPGPIKAQFGEPAVALPAGPDWVRLDPAFVRRHIVTRTVPILGSVTCHRTMLPHLRSALAALARRGLAGLVDPGDYAGCYAPRRIRPGGSLSLHAWGLAVDVNAAANPFGARSRQDRRLVRTMKRHGFVWGGDWPTRRDPMHFEMRIVPAP